MKPKPVVHYRTDKPFFIQIGAGAVVWPVNHPDSANVSNTKEVLTSEVIAFHPHEGGFETMNTIYRPFKGNIDV